MTLPPRVIQRPRFLDGLAGFGAPRTVAPGPSGVWRGANPTYTGRVHGIIQAWPARPLSALFAPILGKAWRARPLAAGLCSDSGQSLVGAAFCGGVCPDSGQTPAGAQATAMSTVRRHACPGNCRWARPGTVGRANDLRVAPVRRQACPVNCRWACPGTVGRANDLSMGAPSSWACSINACNVSSCPPLSGRWGTRLRCACSPATPTLRTTW